MSVPAPVVASGAGGGANRHTGCHRPRPLHHAMRARLGDARFAAMGVDIRTRPSAFEEALDIVRRLLAGETVSSSQRFRIAEASLALRPPRPSRYGSAPASACDRPRSAAGGGLDREPQPYPEEARVQADLYRERCIAYGKEPGAIVLRRDIYVGESSSDAGGDLPAGAQPKLSQHVRQRRWSRDRSARLRNSFEFRGNGLHRHPRAPSDERPAEGIWARWSGWRRCERRWSDLGCSWTARSTRWGKRARSPGTRYTATP